MPDPNEWTTTPPTVPGWYWVRHKNNQTEQDRRVGFDPYIVNVWYADVGEPGEYEAGWQVIDPVFSEEQELSLYTHWLGPLPVPTLPD